MIWITPKEKLSLYSTHFIDFIGHTILSNSVFVKRQKWLYDASYKEFVPAGVETIVKNNYEWLGDIYAFLPCSWPLMADEEEATLAKEIIDAYYDSYEVTGLDTNYCLHKEYAGIFDSDGTLIYMVKLTCEDAKIAKQA